MGSETFLSSQTLMHEDALPRGGRPIRLLLHKYKVSLCVVTPSPDVWPGGPRRHAWARVYLDQKARWLPRGDPARARRQEGGVWNKPRKAETRENILCDSFHSKFKNRQH